MEIITEIAEQDTQTLVGVSSNTYPWDLSSTTQYDK